MQRIKSQSTCVPQNTSFNIQNRPRSKKTIKGQTLDISYNNLSKSKNTNHNYVQNSNTSLKTTNKLSGGSMKNLKVVQYQQTTAKTSAQNTARQANTNSAISARILKQIIGYSNRSAKNKQAGKQVLNQRPQARRLQIDLDSEMQNMCNNIQKSSKRVSENLKNQQTQTRHSSNGKKHSIGIGYKKEQKVIQQFESAAQSQQKARISTGLNENKTNTNRYAFFTQNVQDYCNMSRNQFDRKTMIANFKGFEEGIQNNLTKQFAMQSENQKQEDKNVLEITKQFMDIASPHHSILPKAHKQSYQLAVPIDGQSKNITMFKKNKNTQIKSSFDEFKTDIQSKAYEELLQLKQNLTISLQEASAYIEQRFGLSYKELIPLWNGVIESKKSKITLYNQLQQLEIKHKKLVEEANIKKTELFELNRDQISRKKQKQYFSKSNKQKYIQEAISAQQQLRLKLSSKVDYEHIIVFNQKVVLTGQNSIDDLNKLYTELFEGKLVKKFSLIARKQLVNLSVYDSRVVQQFLKKIQQLQNSYNKIQYQYTSHKSSVAQHYASVDEQMKLEQLVQQIQQRTLNIQNISSECYAKYNKLEQNNRMVTSYQLQISKYIRFTNKSISGQYKMMEGHSFDFQAMLEQKFNRQFQQYQKQIESTNFIVNKLEIIEKQICKKIYKTNHPKNYYPQNQFNSNYAKCQTNERVSVKRSSCSLLSTPSHRKSSSITNHNTPITQQNAMKQIKPISHSNLNFKSPIY